MTPRSLLTFALGGLLLTGGMLEGQAATAPADAYRSARQLLEQGESRGDLAKLKQARELFLSAAQDPELAALAYYHAGYAGSKEFHLTKSRTGRKVLVDRAIEALEKSRQLDGKFGETPALLASLYGLAISVDPQQTMTLGPKIGQLQAESRRLAPDNPRVTLLGAVSLYYTPPQFGGDKAKAKEQFLAAVKQFEEFKSPSPNHPSWGRAEIHAWLGRVHLDAGELAEARKELQKALAADAEYAWVKSALMPELEAAEKAGKSG